MPERTAVIDPVLRLARAAAEHPVVGVSGHPTPWRDQLAGRLRELLPAAEVVVGGPDLRSRRPDLQVEVWLEVDSGEVRRVDRLRALREGATADDPLTGGTWRAYDESGSTPPHDAASADVVFVPVSGVRPPRLVRLAWDWSDDVLWDLGEEHVDELDELLPIPEDLRRRLRAWASEVDVMADDDGADERRRRQLAQQQELAAALAEELGPEFVVET